VAVLSDFIPEQQPFSLSLPPQHAFAVLSFPHPSLQQPAAVLSSFMQDFASFPPQHDAISFASFFP
jgi:hypothetical protein